jgi:hypothetical protein
LCGLGRDLKTFRKHRADAMRGWIECSDGRLYHPVVAEQVNASWSEKLAYRDRKAARKAIAEKAADARWSKCKDGQDADASAMHDASNSDASCMADAMPKGRGRGTGSYSDPDGSGGTPPAAPPLVSPAPYPTQQNDLYDDPPPPPDPAPVKAVDVIFGLGLPMLTKAGVPEKDARSFLGLQRKGGDDKLVEAIRAAVETQAMQPLEFIAGRMNVKPTKSIKAGSHAGFDSKDYHAGANEDGSF